jgi:CBS domain-containing protein
MWRNDRNRPDDPQTHERETQRLARDEYDRPRYGSPRAPQMIGPDVPDRAGRGADSQQHAAPPWAQRPPEPRQRSVEHVPVHELMTRRVATVHPATSIEHAAHLMEECDCGALPVVADNSVLVGMITDRDIALRIVARGRDPRKAIVGDCMTERVFACYANESIAECMRQMSRRQVRRMPIVDERGRLVGIVAQGDLARHGGHHRIPEERRAVADVVCAVSEPRQG